MRNLVVATVAAVMVLLPGANLAGDGKADWTAGAVAVGELAPEFRLKTLDGKSKNLADMKGENVVLLDLWAVWCPPCVGAVPVLNEMHAKFSNRGLVILGIGVPHGQDEKAVRGFLERTEVRYPILFDAEDQVSTLYGAMFVPRYYLIAADGTLNYEGTVLPEDLEERIEILLTQIPEGSGAGMARAATD